MSRPVFCGPEEPLREAASRLGREGVSALLIRLEDDRLGILTDAAVRAAVAVDGVSLDAPVRRAARCPVPTVPADQLAIEATVEMLAAGAEHLAVLEGDRVCGLVSATDLLSLETRSPIALRHVLLGAPDEEALVRAAGRIPGLFLVLARAGVPPPDLGRVLSLQLDTLVARLIEFSIARHGPAPAAWSWLDLGSAARREFTLASDQDNALAYADVSDGDGGRLRRSMTTSPGWARTSTMGWCGAGSAWTTTACSPATASGACPRRAGCRRSTASCGNPTSRT